MRNELENAKAKLAAIDDLVRLGKTGEARLLLKKTGRKLPHALKGPFASLALRLDLPEMAVRALNSVVRPAGRKKSEATPQESAEYAMGLVKLGAQSEGVEMLRTVDPKIVPIVPFYQALACISVWDYGSAIPFLKTYLLNAQLEPYQRLVAQTNLAMALVHERRDEASSLIRRLLDESKKTDRQRVYVNVLMTDIFQAISERELKRAHRQISEAESLIRQSDTFDALFVRKWRAVLALYEKSTPQNLALLKQVKGYAEKRHHWETVRNCDYHQAIATRNSELLFRVYFGSPWESYRVRLLAEFGAAEKIPHAFSWELSSVSHPSDEYDPLSELKVGQSLHRLLTVLTSDFYKPHRIAAIYAEAYPKEYFNPASAPGRIWRIVGRLRDWLSEREIPISVEEIAGGYRLSSSQGCRIRVPYSRPVLDSTHHYLMTLQQAFPTNQRFTAKQVGKLLNLNDRGGHRFLSWCMQNKFIQREGSRKKSVYYLVSQTALKKAA